MIEKLMLNSLRSAEYVQYMASTHDIFSRHTVVSEAAVRRADSRNECTRGTLRSPAKHAWQRR
ncbi:MAG: hypothetical protein LBV26_07085 [Bacteroidales bacterium]|nr:hypothetical protein [Bacteroidales bacterium]